MPKLNEIKNYLEVKIAYNGWGDGTKYFKFDGVSKWFSDKKTNVTEYVQVYHDTEGWEEYKEVTKISFGAFELDGKLLYIKDGAKFELPVGDAKRLIKLPKEFDIVKEVRV